MDSPLGIVRFEGTKIFLYIGLVDMFMVRPVLEVGKKRCNARDVIAYCIVPEPLSFKFVPIKASVLRNIHGVSI
jgi:hypothetical protein